jgi:hypothetical protein
MGSPAADKDISQGTRQVLRTYKLQALCWRTDTCCNVSLIFTKRWSDVGAACIFSYTSFGEQACCKRINTNSQYLRHLAEDVLPGILERAIAV